MEKTQSLMETPLKAERQGNTLESPPFSPIHPCLQLPFANPLSVFKKKRRKEDIELGKKQEIKREKSRMHNKTCFSKVSFHFCTTEVASP